MPASVFLLLTERLAMRFHSFGGLDLIAPHIGNQEWNEAEALGSAVWLWMHSASHRNFPLHTLSALILPALRHRQFLLAFEAGRPVFYLSWANLSLAAEQRYISQHPLQMPDSDWNSGQRLWFLDLIAPFGQTQKLIRIVRQKVFAGRCARYLYHHGNERGMRIKTFHGSAVFPHEARDWFAHHPVVSTNDIFEPALQSKAEPGLAMPGLMNNDPTGKCA
jgi:cytolysin-activating lysine-acyltransferase